MKKMQNYGALHVDTLLSLVTVSLLLLGFVMVSSASLHLGLKTSGSIMHYPLRQMIHIVLGVLVAGVVLKIPMQRWEKYSSLLFIGSLMLLVIVLIPGLGIKVKGSIRWLSVAGLRVQVSEISKACAVMYMAGYITRHYEHLQRSAIGVFRPLFLFVVASALLLMEPDFGSAVVILMIAMGTLFLGGARTGQFIFLFLLFAGFIVTMVYLAPYRLRRVTSFLNPWADPLDAGFQLVQALISFGRGGWFGVGLGAGVQKLFYLPEAHTDFLLSVIAEELGLVGVALVVGLFSLLVWRSFKIGELAMQAGQKFSAYIAYGMGIWLAFQSFVNVGVNMGILPTKGLTLPLMSYGGSSMIIMCVAMALLFRIYSEAIEQLATVPKGKRKWHSV